MDEVKFIDYSPKTVVDEMLTALENGVSEPLYPGDERRLFGEVLASVLVAVYNKLNDACRQKLLRYAAGDVLDAIGETRGCERIEAVAATVSLTFSISEALAEDITIPAGIRVTSDYEHYFATTEAAVLAAGDTSATVEAEAEEGGKNYNEILPGEISVIVSVSDIPLIEAVTNAQSPTGGVDEEVDEPYRERIREVENSYSVAGTGAAYKYWALSADTSIIDASVTVQTPADGTVIITPLCTGGTVPESNILAKVLEKCSADDVRPLTDYVTVAAPVQADYSIDISYYCDRKKEAEIVEAIEGEGGAIEQYIAWQYARLGRDINPDYLKKLVLNAGADRVTVTSPVYTALSLSQAAHLSGTPAVSHTVE